ncbi:MAG: response regulator [Chloroflexi bacterium]|nr:response regulator [Chloroflexota bacterium]
MTSRKQPDHGQPRVLLIEDNPQQIILEKHMLESVGFEVSVATSAVEGADYAMTLLDSDQPYHPTIIVLDLVLPDLVLQSMEGSVLAAALLGRMLDGQIHPATVVALTGELTKERKEAALFAGCSMVLTKPLLPEQAEELLQLALQPPVLPNIKVSSYKAQGFRVFRNFAEKTLNDLRSRQPLTLWTPDDAHLVLSSLTPFPPPSEVDQGRAGALIYALGGQAAAREELYRCAEELEKLYGLHSEILLKFLDGWERRAIVKYYVDHGYYEDSRIYTCIKELPLRISDRLKSRAAQRSESGATEDA